MPLVSKVCGLSMAKMATHLILGEKLAALNVKPRIIPHYGVKESVFPFDKLPEVDPVLGPEMRSTGEVLGIADSFGWAFYKAEEAAQPALPLEGTVLISLADKDERALEVGREFHRLGFKIRATEGTQKFFQAHGIPCEHIYKLHEARPHIVDEMVNRNIHLVINTPIGKRSQYDDSYIRKAAIKYRIPYITTLPAALASAKGIAAAKKGCAGVKKLQDYHAAIR